MAAISLRERPSGTDTWIVLAGGPLSSAAIAVRAVKAATIVAAKIAATSGALSFLVCAVALISPSPARGAVRLAYDLRMEAMVELAAAARSWPGVDSAESEESFASKFRDGVRLLRGAGLFLGGLLAFAAVLSVASAVRLALDLHRDEIEIMRRMGATEAAIRAPFWLHASFEGLAGGALSLVLLYATYRVALHLLSRQPHPILSLFWVGFLDLPTALMLPAVGAAAGFIGSLLSLSKKPRS